MADNQTYDHFEDLILRYLAGEANASETAELEAWVQSEPENKARFMELKKVWMISGKSKIDVDAEWNRLSQKIDKPEGRVVGIRSPRRILSIAAAVLFLVSSATILLMQLGSGEKEYIAHHAIETIDLADGSTVTLNRYSTLTWDKKQKNKRAVSLDGDAFFDVARDETKPFVISANGVEIEVLGTSFYVDARADQEEIDVTVESGRVAVRHGESEVILNPNERAVFNKTTQQLDQMINDDPNFMSVKTQTLHFENSKLDEVADAIGRHFHIPVRVSQSALETCELTATFENKSLSAILQIIDSTMDIDIIQKDKEIILQGSCTLD